MKYTKYMSYEYDFVDMYKINNVYKVSYKMHLIYNKCKLIKEIINCKDYTKRFEKYITLEKKITYANYNTTESINL